MKIVDIRIQVIRRNKLNIENVDLRHRGVSFISALETIPILRIFTDEDIEGTAFGRGGFILAHSLASLKPLLMGEDPLSVERIWQRLWHSSRVLHLPQTALGTIDVALWDIVGKAANLPIYRLLGAYRDRIQVCASSPQLPDVGSYVKQALECKERGFPAYKLHISGIPNEDLAVCRAVREAVGKDMILMHDAVGLYNRQQALVVGRELEKLGFYWFEEPIHYNDIDGLIQLCNSLDIPIASLEVLPGNLYGRAQYITRGAVDIVQSDTLFNGGITPLKKTASLAEAFGINCEIHCVANPLMMAANLHVACSIANCEFFEWGVPDEVWNFGVIENIRLDNEGYAHVPKGPGLGMEVDWEYINGQTIETL